MVTLRSSAPENLDIPEQMQQGEAAEGGDAHRGEISEYELCREERIRENRERMQKLGIFDLTQKLSSLKSPSVRPPRRKTPRLHSPPPPSSSGPVRRSSRLQSSTPVSYCEIHIEKKDKLSRESDILREEGSRPEVYTEEHEKLLGSTEMSWTPFVDGYGKDGKRIYDPVVGKTCHQCRQKTLGHRTHCSNCSMVQGQFCGDCLYMRYGENVLEAKANPDWICPVCRGICNCSLCRQAKGWPPTGSLYRKVSSLGYKSVAHYLIQTRRADADTENNAGSKVPTSAKRSLPFSDIEVTGEVDDDDDLPKPTSEYPNPDPVPVSDKEFGDGKPAPDSGAKPLLNAADATSTNDLVEYPLKPEPEEDSARCATVVEPMTIEPLNDEVTTEVLEGGDEAYEFKKESFVLDNKEDVIAPETTPKSTKKRVRFEPTTPDSIGGRLRMRRGKANTSEELQLVTANHTTGAAEDASTRAEVESIASRLRKRRKA
ncbi:Zinc-finger domain of monoamine-oxidase A repressor R1 [Perilla frutescens var. frutescens]|nr:Zinc-finger domain of monoamine-oxidase A repressor R1 [Perilla frutescens var. frutescens]